MTDFSKGLSLLNVHRSRNMHWRMRSTWQRYPIFLSIKRIPSIISCVDTLEHFIWRSRFHPSWYDRSLPWDVPQGSLRHGSRQPNRTCRSRSLQEWSVCRVGGVHPPLASSVRLPFARNQIETQLLCVFFKNSSHPFSCFSPIITTASHSSYLQSLGATHVLDRNLHRGDIKTQIDEITDEAPIKYVYDAISLPGTQAITIKVMDPEG